MSFQPLSLLSATGPLSLANDLKLLGALVDVFNKSPALSAQLKTAQTPAAIQAAFNAAGLGADYQTLAAWLGQVADATGVLPNKYQGLLETLSALASDNSHNTIAWTITGAAAAPANADYTLAFNGAASLTFKAADTWVDPTANAGQLLSVAAAGNVQVNATATVPFPPLWTLSGGGATSAAVTITYYFKPALTELFAQALVESLPNLANPFDLDSVWDRFQVSALQGVVFDFQGSASVQVQAALANAAALKVGDVANIDFGVTMGVSANVGGEFKLTLYKEGAGGAAFQVAATLSRTPSAGTDVSGSFGIGVDLTPATKSLSQIVATVASTWDSAISTIEPFLSPGTYLRTKLQTLVDAEIAKLVADPTLQQGLIADFQAALGDGGATDPTSWLTDAVTGAFDRASVLIDGDLQAASNRVVTEFTAGMPQMAQAAASQEANQLVTLADGWVATLEGKLETEVTGLLATPLATLSTALGKAGADVTGLVGTLDSVLAPVRTLLANADKQFHALIDPVQQALKQKITAQLTFDDSTTSGTTVEVDGTFKAVDPQTRALFKSLTTGKIQALVDIIDNPNPPANFKLDTTNSSITRFSKTQNKEGIEIAFLGLDFSAQEVIDGSGEIMIDGLANIHVSAAATLDSTFKSPFNTREVSFVSTAALVEAAALRASPNAGVPVLEFGVSASYSAGDLDWGSIDVFIQQLGNAGLVSRNPPGAAGVDCEAAAKATFAGWAGSPSGKINGSVAGSLRLTGDEITTLLQLGARTGPDNALTNQAKLTVIAAALPWVLKAAPERDFARGKQLFVEQGSLPTGVSDAAAVLAAIPWLPEGEEGPTNRPTDQPAVDGTTLQYYFEFFDDVYVLQQLVAAVETMGQVYLAKPSIGSDTTGWTEAQYGAAETGLAQDCHEWVNLWVPATALFSSQISPWTVAFMRAIADLAGLQGKTAAMVTLTCTPPGDAATKTAAFG